jgi:hypothetical protein
LVSWLAIHQGLNGNCSAAAPGWVHKSSSISEMKHGDVLDNNKWDSACHSPIFFVNLFHATNEKTRSEISKCCAPNMLWQPVLSTIADRLTRDGHKLDIWPSIRFICQEGGLI